MKLELEIKTKTLIFSFLLISSCTVGEGKIKLSYNRGDIALNKIRTDDWYPLDSVFSFKIIGELRQHYPLLCISEVCNVYSGGINIVSVKCNCNSESCPAFLVFLGQKKLLLITDWSNRDNYIWATKKIKKEITIAELDSINIIIDEAINHNIDRENMYPGWP